MAKANEATAATGFVRSEGPSRDVLLAAASDLMIELGTPEVLAKALAGPLAAAARRAQPRPPTRYLRISRRRNRSRYNCGFVRFT